MKTFLFFTGVFLSLIVYTNLIIAESTEKRIDRFIIAKNSDTVMDNKMQAAARPNNNLNNQFTANLLQEKENKTKQQKEILNNVIEDLNQPENEQKNPKKDSLPVKQPIIKLIKSFPGKDIQTWDRDRDLSFYFNTDINLESFFNNLKITPSSDNKFSGEINYGKNKQEIIITPIPALKKETNYTINILKGVKSFDNKAFLTEDISIDFTTK